MKMLSAVLLFAAVAAAFAGSSTATEAAAVLPGGGARTTAEDDEDGGFVIRHLPVYGAPLVGVRYGDQPADGLHTQEALGWRALYAAPFILALQQDERPELAAFLVKDGLRSLPFADDRRFLHAFLHSGADKVGVLLSGSNFVSLPQVDMPITRFVLPAHFSLADSARLHADFYSFPTLLVVNRDAVSGRDLARLALVGDFSILPDSVKVSNDVPAPAAKWGRRHTTAHSAAAANSPSSGASVGLALGPFAAGVDVSRYNPLFPAANFAAGLL